jgi:NTP pyrophosphatase (non-canonical NTP hydrolase)
MKFDEYQIEAARTLIDRPPALDDAAMMLLWNAIGVAGEAGEVLALSRADAPELWRKELGDVLWYGAACSTKLGLDLGEITQQIEPERLSPNRGEMPVSASTLQLVRVGCNFAEMAKKQIFHEHGIDTDQWSTALLQLVEAVIDCCACVGITIEDCMEHNIEKLKARYPHGWDTTRSKFREGAAA